MNRRKAIFWKQRNLFPTKLQQGIFRLYCQTMTIRKFLIDLTVLLVMLLTVVACGAPENDSAGNISPVTGLEEDRVQILQSSGVFSVDDVAAAGWKKSKELFPETLPDAISVWYGFYNQRDVEVRVYESQASAIGSGQDIADVATGRRKPAPFASGGISSTRTSYSAYAIVGNIILLCEIKIEDCQGLIDTIE
jgi:hypothetical protein